MSRDRSFAQAALDRTPKMLAQDGGIIDLRIVAGAFRIGRPIKSAPDSPIRRDAHHLAWLDLPDTAEKAAAVAWRPPGEIGDQPIAIGLTGLPAAPTTGSGAQMKRDS